MHLGEPLHQREPQPQTTTRPRQGPFGLNEGVEDVNQQVGVDTGTGITDVDLGGTPDRFEREGHVATAGRELGAVV